jgi:xanthine dehydrogenase accessory factor
MTDLERILALWREVESAGTDYVLATVVAVQGPSYRKPGALMLLTADGQRAGTVSGGCLEAEVASRAWWLTANGPTIQRYSTADEDGERPYGSGCGGVIFLFLERRTTAGPLLAALRQAFDRRVPIAVATVLEGRELGCRAFASSERELADRLEHTPEAAPHGNDSLQDLAERSLARRESIETEIAADETHTRAWADYRPARPGLGIFGAGDDAQPILRQAKELGWSVSVADGRSHLTTRERFPMADALTILPIKDLPGGDLPGADLSGADLPGKGLDQSLTVFRDLHSEDAAVVMTHSFEQDAKILACLLALEDRPAYIGVLGPQRRTIELLAEAARLLSVPEAGVASQAERWLAQLHAPTGLDLGAESPETIALSVLAEIQKFRTSASALPLRKVRAVVETIAG